MSYYQQVPEGKDPRLWKIAQRRTSFKRHLLSYMIVNTFFWILWYFTGNRFNVHEILPWPVWPMFSWGIGIAVSYAKAYTFPKSNSVEREYQN